MSGRQDEVLNLQQTCPHHGLEEVEATQLGDPERRYLFTCRGCGLQYTEFECGRCGKRNDAPKTCGCRKVPLVEP